MKIQLLNSPRFSLVVLALLFIIGVGAVVIAQTDERAGHVDVVPASEQFKPVDELISPWRETGCSHYKAFQESWKKDNICARISGVEKRDAHRLSIYNPDGSMWYSYSLNAFENDYYLKTPKKEFVPFASNPSLILDFTVLRMRGESDHWYEVEVNENTKAIKYILKDDPMWAKTSWEFWLLRGDEYKTHSYLTVDEDRPMLLDKPYGVPIEKSGEFNVNVLFFKKMEGDWAYVNLKQGKTSIFGWMRWRQGREILVGCALNQFRSSRSK
jgi:hypothetical protein